MEDIIQKPSDIAHHKSQSILPKEDFTFQLRSTWYKFSCVIKILRKFSDFIYVKLTTKEF